MLSCGFFNAENGCQITTNLYSKIPLKLLCSSLFPSYFQKGMYQSVWQGEAVKPSLKDY